MAGIPGTLTRGGVTITASKDTLVEVHVDVVVRDEGKIRSFLRRFRLEQVSE